MIELKSVGYRFGDAQGHALSNVSLSLASGERVCVLGANGSGKTTLGELAAGIRHATEGTVAADDAVGFVPCDPREAFVSALVFDEVAFGLRCAGVARKTARSRTLAALERCGIRRLAGCSTYELSAAQQMLVGFASALAVEPAYLVLDDIFALLDTATAASIAALIDDLVGRGLGVLELSTSLERAMGADRVIVLENGVLAWSGTFTELIADDDLLARAGIADDALARLLGAVAREGFPFARGTSDADVVSFISANRLGYKMASAVEPHRADTGGPSGNVLSLEQASVVYDTHAALEDATVSVGDELVVVIGPAGSGKSTLAEALAGVVQVDEGEALFDGNRIGAGTVAFALQRPRDQFLARTVRDDIAAGVRARGVRGDELGAAVERAAKELAVEGLLERKVTELSSGEMRRVAAAGIAALQAQAYIFDGSCTGLDAEGIARMRDLVQRLRAQHRPVVIVAERIDAWIDLASRAIFMRGGSIAYDCDAAAAQTRTQPYVSCGLEPPLVVSVRSLAGLGSKRGGDRG